MAGGGVVALADGGASLTPAQREAAIKAGEAAYKTQQTNIKNIVKPYDPSIVKTPAGGFTNTNVNVAYSPFLVQQRNEVTALQAQLPQYLNADGTPKFGYEGVVSLLRSEIDSNLGELKESLNDFYRNIPRTDLDFTDPKNAAKTTQNQVNEENQINWLIANFINTVPGNAKLGIEGLANTDFGKDFISKRDAESNQRLEASLFQTHFAPVLANIKGEPTAADRVRLQNAMFAAGLIDKTGKPTAKSNQMTGLASFGTETIQGYGETLSPYARKSTTVGGRVPTKDLNSLEKIPITLVNQGWDPDPNKTLEEADVINLFEEVAGRLPTADEMKRFLGRKGTMASAADAINGLPDVQAGGAIFTPQEINAQAKYYWGRDMTKGELEHFTQRALAGQFNNFATLRNALTQYVASGNVNPYKQNLQKQLDASFAPKPEGLSDSKIVEIYRSTLGRMPYEDEYKSARDGKISEADLKKNLLNTNEYLETFVYKKRPTKETGAEVGDTGLVSGRPGGKDTTTTTGTTTGGTTTGGPTKVSEGATLGDTGLTAGDKTTTTETKAPPPPPPRVLTPEEIEAERQRIAKFREAYTTFTPSTKVAEPVLDERQQQAMAEAAGNIYRPQFIPTKELPDITFYKDPSGKSFAYRDPNKELGLTGLYAQMSEVMPSLRGGITFTPTQGAVLASPFSNVTPGLVTLQSTVAPQPYTPPTPVVPGTTTQQVALTPEEQLLLSQAQAMSQNKARGMAMGGYAGGGYHLGDYSDGGRLLKGPGDGVSDSIPASIGNRQPARLADGEFVIPARIVSELGNGSTDAGARQLYAMMDRIQKRRRNTIGKGRVAVDSKARALLPA
jgi:hypothetical protein